MDAETIVWEGRPSPVDQLGTFAVCGLLLWLVVPVFVAAWRWLELACTKYTLTNERLQVASGVLSKRIDEVELYRVKDSRLEMPLHLRPFGRAHVVLMTSDRSHPELRLRAIAGAEMLRDQIRGLVEKRREAKGVRELDV
ncbi:MAG: PH domain-containing protein [Myxococcota bacterium]